MTQTASPRYTGADLPTSAAHELHADERRGGPRRRQHRPESERTRCAAPPPSQREAISATAHARRQPPGRPPDHNQEARGLPTPPSPTHHPDPEGQPNHDPPPTTGPIVVDTIPATTSAGRPESSSEADFIAGNRSAKGAASAKVTKSEVTASPHDTEADDRRDDAEEPQGFIIEELVTSKRQADYIADLLADQKAPSCALFKHILASKLIQQDLDGGWVPVASRLMLRDIEGCPTKTEDVWRPLVEAGVEAGVLRWRPYSRQGRRSREFKIPEWIVRRFLHLAPEEDRELRRWKLMAQTRCRKNEPLYRTCLTDENGHRYPGVIDGVLEFWQQARCLVNRSAVEAHLKKLRAKEEQAFEAWIDAGSEEDTPEHSAYIQAFQRWCNDRSCWDRIRQQGLLQAADMPEGIYEFTPAYAVQEISGRLSCIAGLQNGSGEMKKAAYSDVPGMRNYDIQSSQIYVLRERFEEATIDTRWLDDYIGRGKSWYAEKARISVKLWKRCIYALLFHGTLYGSIEKAERAARHIQDGKKGSYTLSAIAKAIVEAEQKGVIDDAHAAYERLHDLLRPLYEQLKKWHKHLVGPYWEQHRRPARGWYAENPCGIRFRNTDWKQGHEMKSKMAAWILQGTEAAFIHHLTLLSKDYGYEVIANEHDGLVVIGEIPDEAVQKAREHSGFQSAQLEEKPFISGSGDDAANVELSRRSRRDRLPIIGPMEETWEDRPPPSTDGGGRRRLAA